MRCPANDDVVMQYDAECGRCPLNLTGHVDIGLGRRGVSAGMVMHEDQRRRPEIERAGHHLAGIDRRVIDGAFLQDFVAMIRFFLSRKRTRNCSRFENPIAARQ